MIKRNTTRIDLIKQIEEERGSTLICYITGDRQKFETKIADDIIPILHRHLELIGYSDRIDLLLYTKGGDILTPIRIVKLIKNYCSKFSVLIPYYAHSAGTLIALGADEIVMHKLGELTPVDPSTTHPFNPRDPVDKKLIPISVEDISSYLKLAKDKGRVRESQMHEIFQNLTRHTYEDLKHLHPLALGNVYRGQRIIKDLAEKLLSIHIQKNGKNNKLIKKIVNEITSNICIHNYPINRDEAKKLGIKVHIPNENLEKLLYSLFETYLEELQLNRPFNPFEVLGQETSIKYKYGGAFIESRAALDVFFFNLEINLFVPQAPPGQIPTPNINVTPIGLAWERVE